MHIFKNDDCVREETRNIVRDMILTEHNRSNIIYDFNQCSLKNERMTPTREVGKNTNFHSKPFSIHSTYNFLNIFY